jgi:hypothetical protein
VYEGPALGWPEDQWRQRDGFEPPEPQTPADLLDYLRQHPGWHGKDALLTATRFPDHRWNAESSASSTAATWSAKANGAGRGIGSGGLEANTID